MELLLAQSITETVEVKPQTETIKVEEKKEIQKPELSGEDLIDKVISSPMPPSTFGPPLMAPIRGLPMGTVIETITVPTPKLPLGTIPTIPETKSTPVTKTKTTTPVTQKKELSYEEKYGAGSLEEIKQEPTGQITYKREICDGEVHLGPFKSCLKEFTGVPAVGWIAAAAGLIVLWKWLDYKFRK